VTLLHVLTDRVQPLMAASGWLRLVVALSVPRCSAMRLNIDIKKQLKKNTAPAKA
jgi:hypothetical protein